MKKSTQEKFMNHNGNQIESRLWAAADELQANSKLKSSEYSVPVLGLVFLRYADHKFQAAATELEGPSGGRRKIGPADYQAKGVLYLPEAACFSALIQLPEGGNIGAAVNDAMRAIEAANPDLKDVLPKTYNRFENALLKELLKTMNSIPMDIEGDAFGKIYEYFLGHFAMSEGQKGGEFSPPPPLFGSSSPSSNPFTAAFLTRQTAPAACLCRAPILSRSIRKIPAPT